MFVIVCVEVLVGCVVRVLCVECCVVRRVVFACCVVLCCVVCVGLFVVVVI